MFVENVKVSMAEEYEDERMTEAFERLKEEIARNVELVYLDYSEWARPLKCI